MAAPEPSYPFVPKSNASLRAGQFWAVPLSDGRFGCGRVLDVPRIGDLHVPATRGCSWPACSTGSVRGRPRTSRSLARQLDAQGFAHIKTILTTGGELLGWRDLAADRIVPAAWRSHEAGGTVWVYEGARRIRPATAEDRELPVMGTWGYSVLKLLAEQQFVGDA